MKARTAGKGPSARQNATSAERDAGELFASIVRTFANDRAISQSRMFGSPGLKIGGKVFAMLVKGRLVVKLPKERVESLVASRKGEYFDPGHGRLMKEWVAMKASGKNWLDLAKEAREFVAAGQLKLRRCRHGSSIPRIKRDHRED